MKDLHFIMGNCPVSYEEESQTLHMLSECFLPHLRRLYHEIPLALTHNDYNSKNLMVIKDEIVPIDWSNAYLSPHLGDLYCLIREAQEHGCRKSVILDAFQEQTDLECLERQIKIGGLCWLIRGLRWVCGEGSRKVPGTEQWIPSLIENMQGCSVGL